MSGIDLITHLRVFAIVLLSLAVPAYMYICVAKARTGIETRPAVGVAFMAVGTVLLVSTGTVFSVEFAEWLKSGTRQYGPAANLIWTVPSALMVYAGWRLLRPKRGGKDK